MYDHKEREAYWRDYWEKEKIYAFNNEAEGETSKIYSVDTPPPYVSADHLHIGHIMSYSQAEFIVRYKRMQGYNVFYPMGFDDNGLPTERFVEKKYNLDKSKIKRDDFIKLCLEETQKSIKTYRDLWTNLGISVDWSKTYSTIDKHCQRISQWSFLDLYEKGKVFRKKEPILWCPICETALAQADLEDKKLHTTINEINFEIKGKKYPIATTRPELLSACVALFANSKDKRFKDLKDVTARVPLFDYEVPLLFDENVDMKYGTGLMMVCSWGDTEDIRRIKENNLTPRIVINKKGELGELAQKYKGLKIEEGRKAILKDLKEKRLLVGQKDLEHSLNLHERCGTPVEFIPSKQWFIDLLNIKKQLLEIGKKMRWYPEREEQKYIDWVKSLKWDWCISRQRYFGVPFPVWYCKKCGKIKLPKKEELPVDPTLSQPKSVCSCGSAEFLPEKDVMDTWMTSSCTNIISTDLIKNSKLRKKAFPCSLRPQGFDIIRTWLFYTVVKSYYHFKEIPFKDIMISGHGVDQIGRKISKRLNNYIPPDELLLKYGADAIRYWAAGANLGENHRFDLKEIKKGRQLCNKLWNAAKFVDINTKKYKIRKGDKEKLEIEDKWILDKLNAIIKATTFYFENYEYSKAKKEIESFFWNDFCDYYIEIIKHRIDEKSVKYTLLLSLENILKLFAPILPFITEELYQQPIKRKSIKSIHLSQWPQDQKEWEMSEKERSLIEEFLKEIQLIRKEKSLRKIALNTEMRDYKIQTKVDLNLFGKKLEKITKIRIKNPSGF